MKNHKRRAITAAVAFAFAGASAVAWSQQAAKPDEKKPEDDKKHLETISVSAERVTGFRAKTSQIGVFRDAELLDIPMTINVVPQTVMTLQNAQGLFDALKNTAGVTRAQTNGTIGDNLSIRGVATENRTSFRLNGGLPVNNLLDMPMENKERVEVLKGSSALYYGFTSPAGIVNMVTKRAQQQPNASLTGSFNEYGQYVLHADVGRQFGEENQFGLRLNAAGGHLRNGTDGFRGTKQLVSAAFDWRVTENFVIKADVEDIRRMAIEQASVTTLAPNAQGVIVIPNIPDPKKLLTGPWALTSGYITNDQVRADYFINPDWAWMVELGRADTNRERRASSQMQNYNVITGAGTLRVALTRGQSYINQNGRTEVAGRVQTWILDHEVMLGFTRNKRYQNGPSQQTYNIAQNLYDPVVIAEPLLTANLTFSPQDITDKGYYFFDRIRITEQWQVQVGVRHEDYKNVSVGNVYAVKDNTPAYGLLWKWRPDTSIYASYIEGLEEGGTAPLTTVNGGQVLAPGKSKQKELGVRTEAVKGLTISGAYFTIDRASAYTNSANVFVLDGRTNYKGFEYSVNGEVGKQVSLYLSGLFLDAKQENAQNTALIGKIPDNTPKQTHSLFGEYRPDFLPGFGVNAGAYYIGKRPVNSLEQGFIPGYTIFNAGAKYTTRIAGYQTSFIGLVENLANKRYWAGAGGGIMAVGLPRTAKFVVSIGL